MPEMREKGRTSDKSRKKLGKTRQMELKTYDDLGNEKIITLNDADFSPEKNENVISLMKRTDGNWRGIMQKDGKIIERVEIKPEDCLLKLLTAG